MENNLLLDLHQSIHRLADEVDDLPHIAQALRKLADNLPPAPAPLPPLPPERQRKRTPVRPLLYAALDEGLLDWRAFDRAMIAEVKAERHLASRAGRGDGNLPC